MTIDISCPSCQSRYKVNDELAGRTAQCKKCGTKIVIEQPAPTADDATNPESHDDEFKIAEPAVAAARQPEGEEACPMCHAPLLPDSEMCMACGYEFGVQAEPQESEDEARERHEAELRAVVPESAASRAVRRSMLAVVIALTIAMLAFGGWWVMDMIATSSAQGRIAALVDSAQSDQGSPTKAAVGLADEIAYLPAYLEKLSARANQAKKKNPNIGGLQFVTSGEYPKFRMRYGQQVLEFNSPMAKDVPEAWRDAAMVATMIVNLPEDSDISGLMRMQDTIGLIAARRLFGLRKDLNWQLNMSSDPDQQVRSFATQLLLDQLSKDADNSAARASLSKPTTLAEKKQTFEGLQKKYGAAKAP